MAIYRPFAYNSGSTISGSVKFGSLSVGAAGIMDFSAQPGGAQWWAGPDEDLGYVIAVPDPTFSQSSAAGPNAGVRFWRSNGKTDAEFLSLSNVVARRLGQAPFGNVADALTWLIASGLPTTYPRTDYDTDTMTYISGLTTPLSFVQLSLINTFITNLKSGLSITNLSDAFDVLYILAGETAESSLRNLVKRAHDATAVNSPKHTVYGGYKSNSTSSYIDTNFAPGINGVRYTQNDCSIGCYHRLNVVDGAYCSMGVSTTNRIGTLYLYPRYVNSFWARINHDNSEIGVSNLDTRGMFILSRNGINQSNIYIRKSFTQNTNCTTNGIQSNNIYLLSHNSNNSPFATDIVNEMAFAFIGKGLLQAEVNTVTDVFEAYMDSLGKGVIS